MSSPDGLHDRIFAAMSGILANNAATNGWSAAEVDERRAQMRFILDKQKQIPEGRESPGPAGAPKSEDGAAALFATFAIACCPEVTRP